MDSPLKQRLAYLNRLPGAENERGTWLAPDDTLDFLEREDTSEWLTIYAVAAGRVFLHAVFVSDGKLSPLNIEDLMGWNFNACGGWGYCFSFREPPEVRLEPPMRGTGSKTLDGGEQIVFVRTFEGRPVDHSYVELLQPFVHAAGLHFVPERAAYCTLDENGDFDDGIRVLEFDERKDGFAGRAVEIKRRFLDEYAAVTGCTIVRMFDVTRLEPRNFSGWKGYSTEIHTRGEIHYRYHCEGTNASFVRGVQIIGLREPRETLLRRISSLGIDSNREYASFIAHDWRNDRIREISTRPGATVNYFQGKSCLPFELSPAFFKPEVLAKYKADPQKYRLEDRSISCRGAWSLQTYGINDAGQVFTYLVYLRSLPYAEQLYWKSFNEEPKGPISKRAYEADFLGCFSTGPDPVASLRYFLGELERCRVPWWRLRSASLLDQLHAPATASLREWTGAMKILDQAVVEGLEERWWRGKASAVGALVEQRDRSITLVEKTLAAGGFEVEHAREIAAPFREAHACRQLDGHAAGDAHLAGEHTRLTSPHGGARQHFERLCERCLESLTHIRDWAVRNPATGGEGTLPR